MLTRGLGGQLLGLLGGIPRTVWYILAVLLFLSYFAHWNAERGRSEVEARVVVERLAERVRVEASDREAIDAADTRALASETEAIQWERRLNEVLQDAARMPNSGDVCLPAAVADGLRDL